MKIFRPLIAASSYFGRAETLIESEILAEGQDYLERRSYDRFNGSEMGQNVFRDEEGRNYQLRVTVELVETTDHTVEAIADDLGVNLQHCKECKRPRLPDLAHPTEHRLIGNCACKNNT